MFWDPKYWTDPKKYWTDPKQVAERYLKLKQIQIDFVGTDPGQAEIMVERTVKLPPHLGVKMLKPRVTDPEIFCFDAQGEPVTELSFALALGFVVEKTAEKWYDDNEIDPKMRNQMNGYRPNCLQAKMVYKARPLDGIWATAPFLHNGSVPNLYELLSPVAERSKTFYLGSRLFDPEKVGYQTGPIDGGFKLDTAKLGNSNKGHEFNDGPRGNGVIGPKFTDLERKQLVEYLKSFGLRPPS